MAGLHIPVSAYIDRLSGLTGYDGFDEGIELLSQTSGVSFQAKHMGGIALGGPRRRCNLGRLYSLPEHSTVNIVFTRRSLDNSNVAASTYGAAADSAIIGIAYVQHVPSKLRVAAVDVMQSARPASTVAHEVAHLLEMQPPHPAKNDLSHCEDTACIMAADEIPLDTGLTQELFCNVCVDGLQKSAAQFAS
jgi:hypothetical protein